MANQQPLFTTEETLAVDPLILAYLAGFFDGEGTIGVLRIPKKSGAVGFTLRCGVTQTSLPVLEKYRGIFGGRISKKGDRRPNPNWAPAWVWIISGGAAVRFLETIQPYIILKASQIPIALRFFKEFHPLVRARQKRPRVATQIGEQARAELMALHQGRGRDYTRKATRGGRSDGQGAQLQQGPHASAGKGIPERRDFPY